MWMAYRIHIMSDDVGSVISHILLAIIQLVCASNLDIRTCRGYNYASVYIHHCLWMRYEDQLH